MNHQQQPCSGLRLTAEYIAYIGGKKRTKEYFVRRIAAIKQKQSQFKAEGRG